MAIVTHKDLKEEYINNLKLTCDEIKNQAELIFEDMYEKQIRDIKITINIEAGKAITYSLDKSYLTKGE